MQQHCMVGGGGSFNKFSDQGFGDLHAPQTTLVWQHMYTFGPAPLPPFLVQQLYSFWPSNGLTTRQACTLGSASSSDLCDLGAPAICGSGFHPPTRALWSDLIHMVLPCVGL